MFRWLRRWFSRKLGACAPAVKKARYLPRMEALEDRTTPAPLTSTAATNGLAEFANVPSPVDAAPANRIDQALIDLRTSTGTAGAPGLSAFVNLEVEVLQQPAARVADGFDALTTDSFANLSPWSNAAALLEPSPPTALPEREPAVVFNLLPTALRGADDPYSMPSSGSGISDSPWIHPRPRNSGASEMPWGGSLTLWADSRSASAISGTVFLDQNGNSVRDVGEFPMTGVKVLLESKKDGAFLPMSTTVTDANGRYTFVGLPPSGYRIRPEAPAGYRLTQVPRSLSLKPSRQSAGQDFGIAPTSPRESKAAPAGRAAVLDESALLDQVFQTLGGPIAMNDSLVDKVFQESPWPPQTGGARPSEAIAVAITAAAAVREVGGNQTREKKKVLCRDRGSRLLDHSPRVPVCLTALPPESSRDGLSRSSPPAVGAAT